MSSTSTTPFPIDNLPYGVISTPENPTPRCATVLESNAIDLSALEREGYFDGIPGFQAEGGIFSQPTLNTFAALPNATRKQVRAVLTTQLAENPDDIVANPKYATPLQRVTNHFPMDTRNFSDFYCSLEHTQNCSALLNSAIPENWFFIPSVYNGRTSSLRVSGTPVRRPNGVFRDTSQGSSPKFQPSKRFDFELEVGIFLSHPLPPGEILNIADAKDHIFGLVILNDWSARDIQVFEMPPLGPFHGKGAGTSISPWIVTTEALGGALCGRAKGQDPSPLGHLSWVGNGGVPGQETWDVELGVRIIRNGKSYTVTETNLNELYWTPYQQLVHLASAGEGLSTGDIFGTGTLTSARRNAAGENTGIACLLERQLPQNKLTTLTADGIAYLEDGDEVVMDGWCVNRTTGRKFGFGECRGVVLPALEV
ncbi:uncharacterized protein BJX67DRAFT_345393 [Aspergillus lucknowensis]|uniref:Fumarylacetoacetase n=1 Tax=Aspergillus lucknowensis TaxID=176173 RepID=A0ABR4M0X4_9EURO